LPLFGTEPGFLGFIARSPLTIPTEKLPPASADFFHGIIFCPEDGGDVFLRNVGLSQLHGVTTHKSVISIYKQNYLRLFVLKRLFGSPLFESHVVLSRRTV
jgi:hypothetical protein